MPRTEPLQALAVRRVCIPVDDIYPVPGTRRRTIVLVTGDANLRAAAGRCLEEEGYTVIAAPHSGHALLACMTSGPVDVLVSELALEETSGPALAQRIRRDHPSLRTVFLANAGTAEADGVIVRPFTREDLLHAISTRL